MFYKVENVRISNEKLKKKLLDALYRYLYLTTRINIDSTKLKPNLENKMWIQLILLDKYTDKK